MEFKIDTKDTFTVIIPAAGVIDAKLAELLGKECVLLRQKGSINFIIDLQYASELDSSAMPGLIALHEHIYADDGSLVLTGMRAGIWSTLKETESDLLLNIAPKMAEAVDIISMEILERDLLGEE